MFISSKYATSALQHIITIISLIDNRWLGIINNLLTIYIITIISLSSFLLVILFPSIKSGGVNTGSPVQGDQRHHHRHHISAPGGVSHRILQTKVAAEVLRCPNFVASAVDRSSFGNMTGVWWQAQCEAPGHEISFSWGELITPISRTGLWYL